MSTNETKTSPPELEYILHSCRAVSERRYQDALFLLKDGLRQNIAVADRIDAEELITLLRALLTIVESNVEEDFGWKAKSEENEIDES